MKILVVGASGTLGKAIEKELSSDHEIITAGSKSGDLQVDITSAESVEKMYQKTNNLDAVVSAVGAVKFAPLEQMDYENYLFGLQNKLMGQVNLVNIGIKYVNDKASFTLTSGLLNVEPIFTSTSAAMVNGALDGFVTAAANEMPRGMRINIVSPTVFAESMNVYGDYFKGFKPVAVAEVALAFRKSIDNLFNGKVFRVGY